MLLSMVVDGDNVVGDDLLLTPLLLVCGCKQAIEGLSLCSGGIMGCL